MFSSIADISNFVKAGNAIFTINNTQTGNRFTFKVSQAEDNPSVFFVSVLTNPDNTHGYDYLGIIRDGVFTRTAKSRFTQDAPSHRAFVWFHSLVANSVELPAFVEFFHAGRCGRCGRLLTTPESVDAGFGPECLKLMAA